MKEQEGVQMLEMVAGGCNCCKGPQMLEDQGLAAQAELAAQAVVGEVQNGALALAAAAEVHQRKDYYLLLDEEQVDEKEQVAVQTLVVAERTAAVQNKKAEVRMLAEVEVLVEVSMLAEAYRLVDYYRVADYR